METIYFNNTKELKREKENLEKKLEIKIEINGKKVDFSGSALKEYEALIVLDALSFGFSAKQSLTLLNENFIFRILPIKNFTRRKNMTEIRARLIGTEGRTKRTIEEISNCNIVIKENSVGLIAPAENIDEATTALANLIRGSKQANVYRFLEKVNTKRKQYKQ